RPGYVLDPAAPLRAPGDRDLHLDHRSADPGAADVRPLVLAGGGRRADADPGSRDDGLGVPGRGGRAPAVPRRPARGGGPRVTLTGAHRVRQPGEHGGAEGDPTRQGAVVSEAEVGEVRPAERRTQFRVAMAIALAMSSSLNGLKRISLPASSRNLLIS